jgi:hypothetical protein
MNLGRASVGGILENEIVSSTSHPKGKQMSQTTHVPGTTFTMSDNDADRMMSAPRRDSRIERTLFPRESQYVMTGSSSSSRGLGRKRKFKR